MATSQSRPMQFRLATLMLAIVVVAFIANSAVRTMRIMRQGPSSDAAESVAQMCIDYMKANNGKWPNGWDNLRDAHSRYAQKTQDPWTLDELKQRVGVDWAVDLSRLNFDVATDEGSRLVWSRDGTPSHGPRSTIDPRQTILNYLRSAQPANGD